jgi:hypothetical protein
MVKSAIKVVVRVRPTPDFAQGAIDLHQDKKSVKLHLPKNAKFGDVVNSQPQDYNFKCAAAPPVVCECNAPRKPADLGLLGWQVR